MIKLDKVSKSYDGKNVLNEVSYNFENGKVYYINGESGAGKTTLFNIIYGYEKPDSGIITCNSQKIEYMFQDALVFNNLSIRENFIIKLLGRDEKIACNDELFVKALKEFGLDMPLDKLVGTLSGGELQRLQLAEYFLVKPEIILLDEPACKLDKTNKDNIYDIIENKYNNVLRIVITHDAVTEYKNGIILEMRDGTICQN